ncbi:hypothetical protein A7A08_02881 [Methyloligella halotolerans]|uniref:EF-hand domain-containing protein n=1 Tax=Methyloligella halotolerans TaxID=1177755 RepID=A0A1E2RVH8_9HYPH|nr:DUF1007 family protein [Methyloligella halotolerans]ODA66234.1 hypothetical protein A7A08_02881 [Methyloligella halotolerans]
MTFRIGCWQWRRKRLLGAAAMLCALMLPTAASAHPHVWASVQSELVFDKDGKLEAIRHRWTFDQFYSAMAIQGLDTDGDGKYSAEELKPLAEINVQSLNEYDYFTFVSLKGDAVPLSDPIDYWVEEKDGIVVLNFTLPLKAALAAGSEEVKVEVYDPTFFVAFSFADEDPLKMAGAPTGCEANLKTPLTDPDSEALTEAFFSQLGPDSNVGSQFAQSAVLSCKS